MNTKKICIAASAGGHLTQLLLIQSLWQENEVICVSTGEMVKDKLELIGRTYIVGECNREHLRKTFVVAYKCLLIIIKERPQYIISTGAAVGFLICFWGFLFRSKIIWVDSIANTVDLSMSGRMVRRFANLILTQWPEIAEKYQNVEYVGELI